MLVNPAEGARGNACRKPARGGATLQRHSWHRDHSKSRHVLDCPSPLARYPMFPRLEACRCKLPFETLQTPVPGRISARPYDVANMKQCDVSAAGLFRCDIVLVVCRLGFGAPAASKVAR